ncbi:DUF2933 domain-containing protein [Pseudarthrobacter sp. NPDC058362]|uniref:DUF2933 domain-containing protein n=1 Tax=Pseudarthrobacter sp. NPDC058362 TaxID=3346458 RepID=UPI00365E38B1
MSSFPGSRRPEPPVPERGPFQTWTQTLLTVLIAAAALYLISNHWLHILDSLPYVGVVLVMSLCMFGHGGHSGDGGSHQGDAGQESGKSSGHPWPGRGADHVQ